MKNKWLKPQILRKANSKFGLIGFFCITLLACSRVQTDSPLCYKIRKDKYAVIVVNTNAKSEDQITKDALAKAAQITREKGYSNFTIQEGKKIYVAKNGSKPVQFPTNLYQDLILKKDFIKESIQQEESGFFEAYQLVILMQKNDKNF